MSGFNLKRGQSYRFGLFLTVAAVFLMWGEPGRAAPTNYIRLGKYSVHATRLLARYAEGPNLQAQTATLQSVGMVVEHRSKLVPGLVVLNVADGPGTLQKSSLPSAADTRAALLLARIQALEASGSFQYVQPSYLYTNTVTPDDERFVDNTLWGLRNTGTAGGVAGADIDAVKAWDLTTGSTNVIVAVVDTGIRYTHLELASQMWRNPDEIPGDGIDNDHDGWVDDVYGVNTAEGNGNPFDDNDHGTHVSGTIGAAANDGNPHVGVAWNVRLMACKFLAADGFGGTDEAIGCIDYAVEHGARIINASWGGGPFERALLDSLTAARRAGVLFVAAAGNDSSNNDELAHYPSSYKLDNVISVAALDRHDRLASFSNYGETSVHIGAPGEEIFSCVAASDSSYDSFDGTSMATPHVSGVAALILAKFPNASIPEVRGRLLTTAVPIPTLAGRTTTGGRVNAFRALSAMPDGTIELALDPPENSDLSARRPVPFYVTVTDLAAITNAIVTAKVQDNPSEVTFRNDGTGVDFKSLDEVYSAELTLPTTPGPFGITFTVTAPGKTALTQTVGYNIASPPLNDNFADALDLPSAGGTVLWTNRFATIEPLEPKHASTPSAAASVWWNWVPAADARTIVDLAGSSFDTLVAVYTNSSLTSLKEVASADDAGNQKQGHVLFDAKAGTKYHIAVAGFSAADVGAIRLRVEPGGGPDTNAPRVIITGPASGLIVTNTTDNKLVVTGTAEDLAPNTTGVRQVQVQVNRELASTALGTTNWTSNVLLKEGQNRIKIVATDYAGNSSPTRSVTVTYQPLISPNDMLANAFELTGTNDVVAGNNTRAAKEPGEPAHAGNAGGKSVWWSYRPGTDGVLTLNTANSTFNTLLALYRNKGLGMAGLELVASNDDVAAPADFSRISQVVRSGETYSIAVDGFGGASGIVQLEFNFRPATIHFVTVHDAFGGTVSPASNWFEDGKITTFLATPASFYAFDHWSGAVSSTDNPLALSITGDFDLVPNFRSLAFTDGFETGALTTLPWRSSGVAAWTVQTNVVLAGRYAVRSGAIGNGERSSLLLTEICRAGTGAFAVKVSSEPTWDKLDFYLNGKRLTSWSGELGWTNYQFSISAGTNTFEWRYSKDFLDTKAGLDAAFVDNLDLPLTIPIDESTPARLDLARLPTGGYRLTVHGQAEQLYEIQSSAALNSWNSISTNSATGGVIDWSNLPTPSTESGFFRALVR